MAAMTRALISEIELQKEYMRTTPETLYFGGGTPSILDPQQLRDIINKISNVYDTSQVKEITLEANPEDINHSVVEAWQEIGINRVSLGIQTFNDKILNSLNRVHSGQEALKAIEVLQAAQLKNITIDLIYGLPNQDLVDWQKNLATVLSFEIPHLSAYALTVENKTVFGHQQKKGKLEVPADESYREQYMLMCELLKEAGYEHYEVSNFAKPGCRSQHNQLYWQGKPYLGIGPGAHSFDGFNRTFNVSNNARYIRSLEEGKLPHEVEVLSLEEKFSEYLLTRLRTNKGINLDYIKAEYNRDLGKDFNDFFEQCLTNNLGYFNNENFILTETGFFVSDGIILELMN